MRWSTTGRYKAADRSRALRPAVALHEKLNRIVDTPLQKITRAADLICLQFGDLEKARVLVRDVDEKLVLGEALAGRCALHVACGARMHCGQTVLFAKGDLYQPSGEALRRLGIAPDEPIPEDFDYDAVGNNRLDEILSAKCSTVDGFIVKSVAVNHIGDLHIRFGNGFEFQACIDVSGPEEWWRFLR